MRDDAAVAREIDRLHNGIEHRDREIARLTAREMLCEDVIARLTPIAKAAEALIAAYRDPEVCSPGPRFEPLLDTLAEAVDPP